jgi:LPS export ABC transporter protein LptC
MTSRTRNLLLFVLLSGAALGTWMLARDPEPAVAARAETAPPPGGFYYEGATLYGTDENGRIQYQIEAERVAQEKASVELALDAILVRYSAEAEVIWEISAGRGIASENLGQFRLMDDIRMTLSPEHSEDPFEFRTDELMLYADEHRVVTESTVFMSQGNVEWVGEGLTADLEADIWECCVGAVFRRAQ